MRIPGRPGVLAGDKNYQPIDVEIPFYLMAYTADEMEDVHRRFRQGWRGARFEIQADHPLSPLFLTVTFEPCNSAVENMPEAEKIRTDTSTARRLLMSRWKPGKLKSSTSKNKGLSGRSA